MKKIKLIEAKKLLHVVFQDPSVELIKQEETMTQKVFKLLRKFIVFGASDVACQKIV